jgi:hypothetical protein
MSYFTLTSGVLTSGGFALMRSAPSNPPVSFGNALTKLFIPITQATNQILILLQNPEDTLSLQIISSTGRSEQNPLITGLLS